MPVLDEFILQINYENIEGVDSNTFVRNNKELWNLLIFCFLHDWKIAISNIEFVGPLDKVLAIFGFVNIHSEKIVTKLLFLLVWKNVEVLVISDDILDSLNFFLLIKI